jgi:hypothetical protein
MRNGYMKNAGERWSDKMKEGGEKTSRVFAFEGICAKPRVQIHAHAHTIPKKGV